MPLQLSTQIEKSDAGQVHSKRKFAIFLGALIYTMIKQISLKLKYIMFFVLVVMKKYNVPKNSNQLLITDFRYVAPSRK